MRWLALLVSSTAQLGMLHLVPELLNLASAVTPSMYAAPQLLDAEQLSFYGAVYMLRFMVAGVAAVWVWCRV